MPIDDGIDWGALQGELPNDNGLGTYGTDWWSEGYGQDPNRWDPQDGSSQYDIWGSGPGTPAVSGQSLIQKLMQSLKGGGGQSDNLANLSSLAGAFSSGEKANRFMQGNFTQNYDRLMMDAEKNRNANESDALKKLGQTSYIMGGGSQFKPALLSLNGKPYQTTDQGLAPKPTTDAEKAGATSLQAQLGARLAPGGSYTPQPLNDYAKPGLAENIGSYGATGLGALGGLSDLSNGGGGSGIDSIMKGVGTGGSIMGMMSKLPGLGSSASSTGAGTAAGAGSTMGNLLGKAVPIAGAAMGTYGLIKNQSVGSDVMAGMGAGASLGSFGGPIGTAIGAGVGALVGALRGAFSVTGKEQGGRDAQAQVAANLKTLSSPQQQAEAAHAGWPDPNQALALVVMRDKLAQSGLPPQQAEAKAEAYMHSIWDAEKSGSQAVQQAASPIQSMMGRG